MPFVPHILRDMSEVRDQYESYPARDPRDKAQRLIMGSPFLPQEIDHRVMDGRREWSQIAQVTGCDPLGFGGVWARVEAALMPWGMLLYSTVLR